MEKFLNFNKWAYIQFYNRDVRVAGLEEYLDEDEGYAF